MDRSPLPHLNCIRAVLKLSSASRSSSTISLRHSFQVLASSKVPLLHWKILCRRWIVRPKQSTKSQWHDEALLCVRYTLERLHAEISSTSAGVVRSLLSSTQGKSRLILAGPANQAGRTAFAVRHSLSSSRCQHSVLSAFLSPHGQRHLLLSIMTAGSYS